MNSGENSTQAAKSFSNVDATIAAQVRSARISRHMTQTEVAKALGISLHQFQKYEQGLNRITASRVAKIAEVIGVPVASFFVAIGDNALPDLKNETVQRFIQYPSSIEFIDLWIKLPEHMRDALMILVKAMSKR